MSDSINKKKAQSKIQIKAQIKKFNFEKYLLKNKFEINNNNTHMEHKDFYKNLINNSFATNTNNPHNKNINFYLTNGTNKGLYKGGKGTNKAITIINKDFFILDNKNNIFCPIKFESLGNKEIQQIQQIHKENIYCINPGSVFYKEIKNNIFKGYNIQGVYHINGWNHKLLNVEDLDDYKKLVSLYYIAILDHFFQNIYSEKKFSILHLIQCPGFLFSGTEITTDIFINTICGYLFLKKKQIGYNSDYFRISIDYDCDYKIKYKDVKYLYNLIKKTLV
jgi:hypothetical protein